MVFCSKMTKVEIDWLWLHIEKWWQWAIFGQEVRLWPWYFADKWQKLKLIHFDCTLKVMKMRHFWPKSKAITLVFCRQMTKIEIDSFWLHIEKWWKWGHSQSINFKFGHFSAKYQGYSLTFWPQMPHFHFCPKSKAITLVFCRKMTKIEIDSFWLHIEKWWKWGIFAQIVRL